MAKKKRKGFSRSQKQWEESIARHIGKFIDNLTAKDIETLLTYGIAAYAGHQAASNLGVPFPQSLGGSATAMIGLKLATSMNPIAGASGVITLAGVGLTAIPQIAGAMIEGVQVAAESAEHAAKMVIEKPETSLALAGITPLLGVPGIAWAYGHMMGWW